MFSYLRSIGTIFFANQCPVCFAMQDSSNVCSNCFKHISFLNNACKKCQEPFDFVVPDIDVCEKCIGKDNNFYHEMHCVFSYSETIKNLLVRLKNHDDYGLAVFFAKFIAQSANNLFDDNCLLVPVPLFKKRLIWRGYNQSVLLARALKNALKKTLKYEGMHVSVANVLERVRDTNSQGTKTLKEREENVRDAFALAKNADVRGKHCIIIDDVITTGATAFECAKILHKAGAWRVDIVAVARRLRTPRMVIEN